MLDKDDKDLDAALDAELEGTDAADGEDIEPRTLMTAESGSMQ